MPNSKISNKKTGFTMIEMVFVLALVSVVAGLSVSFSIPALSQVSCIQDFEMLNTTLGRARHLAQFISSGDVRVMVSEDKYEIIIRNNRGQTIRVADTFARLSIVPVDFSEEIVFLNGSGAPTSDLEISIGGTSYVCSKTIRINTDGKIF